MTSTWQAVRIARAQAESPRDRVGERVRDLQQIASLLAGLPAADKDAIAYQHVKDGCVFDDSDVRCPICGEPSLALWI